jgi:hypothetical protein
MKARAFALVLLASSPLLAGGDAPSAPSVPPVGQASAPAPAGSAPFVDAWRALGATVNKCSERELHFDYWPDGGIRNFYCHALTALSYEALVKVSGTTPFVRGPHSSTRLSLNDPRDFGRYNPAFVRRLVDSAIPAADDAALRAETQPLYDTYVRQLARVYFVVHRRLESQPAFKKKMRNEYLRVMDEKNPNWGAYYDKFSTFLGEADSDWGGYDPNLQSAAVAWWLRRDVDKTAPLFLEGLTKLLRTYDAQWLDGQRAPGKKQ